MCRSGRTFLGFSLSGSSWKLVQVHAWAVYCLWMPVNEEKCYKISSTDRLRHQAVKPRTSTDRKRPTIRCSVSKFSGRSTATASRRQRRLKDLELPKNIRRVLDCLSSDPLRQQAVGHPMTLRSVLVLVVRSTATAGCRLPYELPECFIACRQIDFDSKLSTVDYPMNVSSLIICRQIDYDSKLSTTHLRRSTRDRRSSGGQALAASHPIKCFVSCFRGDLTAIRRCLLI